MIHVLEKHIADKIAAGEVIDRPVSIIKELLENSIDAGADQITVEIRNGGKVLYPRYRQRKRYRSGRHGDGFFTSCHQQDQQRPGSGRHRHLGFRGEALASICAVARVELISKTADAKMGRRVVTEGSEILANEGIGCPEGTTVTRSGSVLQRSGIVRNSSLRIMGNPPDHRHGIADRTGIRRCAFYPDQR